MKTHEFDGVSFFTGLIFAVLGLLYLIPRDVTDIVDLFIAAGDWFWPVLLLAVGLAVIVPALMPSRRGRDDEVESGQD